MAFYMRNFVMLISVIFGVIAIVLVENSVGQSWNYDNVNDWPNIFPECGGPFQSPIDIDPATSVKENYPRFIFGNYGRAIPLKITNNGHSVLIHLSGELPEDMIPYVRSGGLEGKYYFHRIDFHWGSDPSQGSEHSIQYQRFPAELQIVHYNSIYGSYAEATKHSDGLVILAVFIELEKRDNIAFRHIVGQFPSIKTEGYQTNLLSPIPLADFLPDNILNFYRYSGSLTTPACNESVIWIIFNTPIAISDHQLSLFRKLLDSEGRTMQNNFRLVNLSPIIAVTYRSENGLPLN